MLAYENCSVSAVFFLVFLVSSYDYVIHIFYYWAFNIKSYCINLEIRGVSKKSLRRLASVRFFTAFVLYFSLFDWHLMFFTIKLLFLIITMKFFSLSTLSKNFHICCLHTTILGCVFAIYKLFKAKTPYYYLY